METKEDGVNWQYKEGRAISFQRVLYISSTKIIRMERAVKVNTSNISDQKYLLWSFLKATFMHHNLYEYSPNKISLFQTCLPEWTMSLCIWAGLTLYIAVPCLSVIWVQWESKYQYRDHLVGRLLVKVGLTCSSKKYLDFHQPFIVLCPIRH